MMVARKHRRNLVGVPERTQVRRDYEMSADSNKALVL